MVLDFQVQALRDDVVRVLRPETSPARARTAYDLYVAGERARRGPGDATTRPRSSTAAPSASIRTLAIAYTNLGNIRFRRGDEAGAEELYRRAIEVDPRQPEAHYNLGYVMLERGDARGAIAVLRARARGRPALRRRALQPGDGLGAGRRARRARARTGSKYLELEPSGTWADVAREHLGVKG